MSHRTKTTVIRFYVYSMHSLQLLSTAKLQTDQTYYYYQTESTFVLFFP